MHGGGDVGDGKPGGDDRREARDRQSHREHADLSSGSKSAASGGGRNRRDFHRRSQRRTRLPEPPELTAERFLKDPFAAAAGARMYRTGDLGALLPDGQIAFHGRLDNQEKIRGHRIEPDEIVSVLTRHAKVASAAVADIRTRRGAATGGILVPAAGEAPRSYELREFLSRELPEYMIPSAFVRMTALPLNSNGKLDRTALPAPAPENTLDTIPYNAPASPIEIQVA